MWRSSSKDALGISKNALCLGFEHLHKSMNMFAKRYLYMCWLYFRILSKKIVSLL